MVRRVGRLGAGAAVAVVAVVAAVATQGSTAGTTSGRDRAAVAARGGATAAATGPARVAVTAPRTGSVEPEPPRQVVLPSGRSDRVVPVSTTADGSLDVPADVDVAGWWRGGSRVGDPFGSTLLSAHVDSVTKGLGPFVELLSVEEGDRIVLRTARLRQDYAVTSLRLLDKGPLAEHPWVYSASGPHRLVMVTCAGPYDPSKGGYQRLAVVTATAVGGPVERSAG